MLIFWILGITGALLFAVSLLLGDLLDGVFDALDGGAGVLSTASIGAFCAAFGLTGAGVMLTTAAPIGVAVVAGLLAGVLLAALAARVTRFFRTSPTDRAPRGEDLIDAVGVVITAIPEIGYGEISLTVGGHRLKLNARSPEPVPSGGSVVVTEVISATAVRVRANW